MPARSAARWALILLAGLATVYVARWAILPEARKASLYGAGDTAARVGGWPEALACFRTLAELDPDYRDVQDRLGEALRLDSTCSGDGPGAGRYTCGGVQRLCTSSGGSSASPGSTVPVAYPGAVVGDPVTSPTGQFTQVVTVRLGNGEAVTVTAESGRFATVGDFDAYFHPASVTVALLPNTVHHLEVFGQVRVVEHDGCVYGGYTLSTRRDKNGAPLVIEQRADLTHTVYFPVIMCH